MCADGRDGAPVKNRMQRDASVHTRGYGRVLAGARCGDAPGRGGKSGGETTVSVLKPRVGVRGAKRPRPRGRERVCGVP